MVGELLEHLAALELLAVGEVGGDLLLLGFLAGPVIISPLQRDIDEAGDLLALAYRDPARDQGRFRHRLQRLEQALDRAARLIDLVDEDHVRDAELLELAQRRLGEQSAVRIGIDHHQSEVGHRRAERAVGGEADRAGRVDQRIAVAHIVVMHQVELGRAAARARLGAGVADARSRPPPSPAARSRRPQKEGPRLGWSYPPRRGPRARSFWCLQLWWAYRSPWLARAAPRRRRGRAPDGKRPASTCPWRLARGEWGGSSRA